MTLRILLVKWKINVSLKVRFSRKCEKWADSLENIKYIVDLQNFA